MPPRTVRLALLLLTAALLLVSCTDDASSGSENASGTEPSFRKDGTLTFVRDDGSDARTIDIEIADTDEELARGLMYRRSMGYDQGMLFLLKETNAQGFWMKNTPLPLDIIFLAPDSTIINIAKRTTPFSKELIRPEAPKRYVVEVRGGFTDRFNIEPGMTVEWTRGPSATPSS